METKRLILFVVFSFALLLLWDSWQQKQLQNELALNNAELAETQSGDYDSSAMDSPAYQLNNEQKIFVKTSLYEAEINTVGGDVRKLKLVNFQNDNKDGLYEIFTDEMNPLLYIAQSGLIGKNLPSHKDIFKSEQSNYESSDQGLVVPLTFENDDIKVVKSYVFSNDNYQIKLITSITNKSDLAVQPQIYYQLLHDHKSAETSGMMPTFTGVSYFNDANKFKKIDFDDIDNQKPFSLNSNDGWIGIIQRYFASAWIIPGDSPRQFYTKRLTDGISSAGVRAKLSTVEPGSSAEVSSVLYSGPQLKKQLLKAAPGMEYTVDYGWLTFIASPLFSLLSGIQKIVHNWGVSIILLTLVIKIFFYPLSASSYRSMAQLKEVAPRLQSMKEKFGDDKQKMQQAMMELYKTEKINPLGGCLPILIQIPVFIALYWVLLGAVELRQAPFFGWITDLSVKDPLYILPILMAASMFLQQKLNPKPTDPTQARLMMMMPIVFSIFFFFFPAGLVLYWFINNVLSMMQQWYVNKQIHANALKKKGNG
ncbi:MAG: membrane protein insertase YidC [Methylophilaceae bacterium]